MTLHDDDIVKTRILCKMHKKCETAKVRARQRVKCKIKMRKYFATEIELVLVTDYFDVFIHTQRSFFWRLFRYRMSTFALSIYHCRIYMLAISQFCTLHFIQPCIIIY